MTVNFWVHKNLVNNHITWRISYFFIKEFYHIENFLLFFIEEFYPMENFLLFFIEEFYHMENSFLFLSENFITSVWRWICWWNKIDGVGYFFHFWNEMKTLIVRRLAKQAAAALTWRRDTSGTRRFSSVRYRRTRSWRNLCSARRSPRPPARWSRSSSCGQSSVQRFKHQQPCGKCHPHRRRCLSDQLFDGFFSFISSVTVAPGPLGPWPPSKFGPHEKRAIREYWGLDNFLWPPHEPKRGPLTFFLPDPPSLANLQAPLFCQKHYLISFHKTSIP